MPPRTPTKTQHHNTLSIRHAKRVVSTLIKLFRTRVLQRSTPIRPGRCPCVLHERETCVPCSRKTSTNVSKRTIPTVTLSKQYVLDRAPALSGSRWNVNCHQQTCCNVTDCILRYIIPVVALTVNTESVYSSGVYTPRTQEKEIQSPIFEFGTCMILARRTQIHRPPVCQGTD